MNALRLFLREIKIEHTLFALPFAYVGALLAAPRLPTLYELLWITLAVLGARTAAMAANRYFDRDLDRRNPRTAQRALAVGTLPPQVMLWATLIGLALLVVAAAQLNPLCLKLLPLAAIGVVGYPLLKRHTWLVHFVLGAVDACAPLGAAVAVAGAVRAPGLWLFVAVTVWVAGFDILYALMDERYDRTDGMRSFPVRFGAVATRRLAPALHGVMVVSLGLAGITARAPWPYALGLLAAIALVIYERRLIARVGDAFALNARIFTVNMAFSLVFLTTTLAAVRLRG